MLNKILIALCLTVVLNSANAQIELHLDGVSVVSPALEVDGAIGGINYTAVYYVVNTTSEEVGFFWNRLELATQNCTDDQVCVGFSCYSPPNDNADFPAPETIPIPAGDSVSFKMGIESVDNPCCALHRYYLKTGLGTIQDSIDVKFKVGGTDCFLSTDAEAEKVLSVYPNPAADIFNVTIGNVSNASVQLYNAVGEQVLAVGLVEGVNEVNIATLPNGVYFYAVSEDGIVIETKKLVVRH